MNLNELLARLQDRHVTLSLRGEELVVNGKRQALDAGLLAQLRDSKVALVALLREGGYAASSWAGATAPPNGISPDCDVITPSMLPLVALTQPEIDGIVHKIPGGVANVQDIYPLAPLQEGILFHHLMTTAGDPYLLHAMYSCATRDRLDALLRAMQAVTDRHDILRTAILWEGLPEPVQVVLRAAPLRVEEVEIGPDVVDVAAWLLERFDPRRFRIDVGTAPLMRVYIAHDARRERWVMLHLFHHVAIDHTSMEVMRDEIEAFLAGRATALPPALPFRNFVARSRQGVSREAHEAFFSDMLGDVTTSTAPFGIADVQGDGGDIEDASCRLDAALLRRLRECARVLGVSAASICHLAWAQVLARLSGQDDVVFGTVLSGRMHGGEGAERVPGLFMNTLPVRIRVDETGALAGLRRTHALLTELVYHEHAPLTLAQRQSGVPVAAPLFTTFLNYRHGPGRGGARTHVACADADADVGCVGEDAPWAGIAFESACERSNYPLNLNVDDLGDTFSLTAHAQAPIDARRVCAYMHTALEQLVQALERAPSTPLSELDVLPQEELRQLLVTWNDTDAPYPDEACLPSLFEAQVVRSADAVALSHEGKSLDYAELNRRANRLAHYLRERGVAPDVRVALCMERSVEMVVGLIAVLKAGGAYVPLDPAWPDERLAVLLEDCAPALLLTHGPTRHRFTDMAQSMLDLDADEHRWADAPVENPSHAGLNPDHLAYVIYTSGTTGRPKGVMNAHRGVVNRLHWMQQAYGLAAVDVVLQKTPFAFDVSVWEFFWPLLNGARLALAPVGGHRDPAVLARVIREEGVSVVHFVPSMLQAFIAHEASASCGTLERIVCSGETLSAALAARCRERFPQACLENLYGPTEAAVDVTAWACPRDGDITTVPIGRPIANTRIYVLDHRGRPTPLGVAGELHIGGVQVARGYLNQPEISAERFIRSPFDHKGWLYKTGDLACYRSDGNLLFLGRRDAQLKVRGMRVEPGEIEARLLAHPGVREAAVVGRTDEQGGVELVGYYSVRGEGEGKGAPGPGELRTWLLEALPEHLAPVSWVELEALPLTSNGKLDRAGLPSPQSSGVAAAYEAPRGRVEQTLARIWREVLRCEQVSRHDNFFALGGHSLLAIIVISRMRQEGLHAEVGKLFLAPTLAELATAVGSARTVEVPRNLIPTPASGPTGSEAGSAGAPVANAVELRV